MPADYNQFGHALAELCGTPVGKPVVRDGLRTRTLRFDAFGIQSSMRRHAPFELDLPYTRAMMTFGLFRRDPKDILIVGLGGGSLSKYCFHKFPSARVTTVEIDASVIALREQFLIPSDSERFRIVHADAAAYLSDKTGVADVILLDGYDASGLPAALSSQGFYHSCYTALRSKGVLVANLLHNDLQLLIYLDRMRRACDGRLFRTSAQCGGNIIAVGLKQQVAPEWGELHARAKDITSLLGFDLSGHVGKMERHHREGAVTGHLFPHTLSVGQGI